MAFTRLGNAHGHQTAARVVRTYLVIAGLYTLSASLIWGVNTLLLLDAGLDIFQTFIANAAFMAGMVIFEIPTGVIADTSGRRLSFLLSSVTLLIGTLAYVSIWAFGGGSARRLGRGRLLAREALDASRSHQQLRRRRRQSPPASIGPPRGRPLRDWSGGCILCRRPTP
jgi:hypothetical protein